MEAANKAQHAMHIRGFDGLRATAMLLVFFTHKTAWGAATEIGFSGVWLFFLLSGFLIGGQLMAARGKMEAGCGTLRRELGLFWLKRAMRIFPAYYLVILFAAPFYLLTARSIPGLPAYLSYTSNIYFQQHHAEFLTTWAHFWTLAVEEQFYVLFAPLILLVPSRHATKACLVVVASSLAQRFGLAAVAPRPEVIYIDSLVNFGILALGTVLFIHRASIVRWMVILRFSSGLVGCTALVALVATAPLAQALAGPTLVRLQLLYVGGVGVAVLLLMNVVANQRSRLVGVLDWRWIAYFGRISYGLYLYNDYVKTDVPERVLRVVGAHGWMPGLNPTLVDALTRTGTLSAAALQGAGLLICFVLLVGAAHLSWIAVEKPSLRFRNYLVAWSMSWRQRTTVEERLDVAVTPSGALR